MRRRPFGCIEKLPSGNYRAYWKNEGVVVRAPKTFPAKRAAEQWLAEQQTALAAGKITPQNPTTAEAPPPMTLDQWQQIYMDRCKRDHSLSPKTIQTYLSGYRTHLEKPFGGRTLSAITVEEVRDWYNNFNPYRLGARKSAYRTLSVFLGAAVREGLIEKSPARVRGAMSKTRRKPDDPRAIVVSPQQAQAIADAMPPNLAITILLGFWCSLRFGEITELRRKDIQWNMDGTRAVVQIRRAVQYAAGFGYVVGPPKTEAGVRDVTVPPSMLEALREHLDDFVAAGGDSLLVHSPVATTRWLSNNSLNHYFKKAVRCVEGVDQRFTFHGLRHSGLTYAGQCGATLAELLARAGHSDVETVLIYQHATRERDAALAERMSAGV